MSELPEGVAPAVEPPARASAAGVLVAADGRILLGLRSRRARYMPGHLSFPGGVVEPADGAGEDRFSRCVAREVAEETGVELAATDWLDAGERTTPPLFPQRFRTRFFAAALPAAAAPHPASEENEELRLAAPHDVLEQWAAGTCLLPPPVLAILRALESRPTRAPREVAIAVGRANALEERAPRIEFAPGIWMLPVRTATLPPATHTNVWLPGGRRFAIVDPGSAEIAESVRLVEVIERRRRELGHEPAMILLTHHHRDHVEGALALAARLGLPIAAHPLALARLGQAEAQVERRALGDGQTLDLEGMTLEVWHTPGHAPDHLALRVEPQQVLIAGDLISGLSTILIDPAHGDMEAYLASLERARAAGCRLLLPGHGPPLPARALDQLIAHRREREARIVERLASGTMELAALAHAAYDEAPELPAVLIEGQTLSHLLRLEQRGRAWRVDRAGRSWRGVPA